MRKLKAVTVIMDKMSPIHDERSKNEQKDILDRYCEANNIEIDMSYLRSQYADMMMYIHYNHENIDLVVLSIDHVFPEWEYDYDETFTNTLIEYLTDYKILLCFDGVIIDSLEDYKARFELQVDKSIEKKIAGIEANYILNGLPIPIIYIRHHTDEAEFGANAAHEARIMSYCFENNITYSIRIFDTCTDEQLNTKGLKHMKEKIHELKEQYDCPEFTLITNWRYYLDKKDIINRLYNIGFRNMTTFFPHIKAGAVHGWEMKMRNDDKKSPELNLTHRFVTYNLPTSAINVREIPTT